MQIREKQSIPDMLREIAAGMEAGEIDTVKVGKIVMGELSLVEASGERHRFFWPRGEDRPDYECRSHE